LTPNQLIPNVTRVVHQDYGVGTVLDAPGKWILVDFDDHPICAASVHIEDLELVADPA
jgi:predicted trehalose synthase